MCKGVKNILFLIKIKVLKKITHIQLYSNIKKNIKMQKKYIKSIETIEKNFEIVGSDGFVRINTSEFDFLGLMYISIELVSNPNKPFEIMDYFDLIKFTFNGNESVICSQIALMILQISNTISMNQTLDKLLSSNPIYIPIKLFSEPVYIKNQLVTLELKGIKPNENIKQITLIYDICIAKSDFVISQEYLNFKIPLIIYTTVKNYITNQIIIPHTQDKLQEIFWIYISDFNPSKPIHPVLDISIGTNLGTFRSKKDVYYTIMNQNIWYSSFNPDLYSYSFVLYPENLDSTQGTMVSEIQLKNNFKPEFEFENLNDYSQIVVLKSISEVELI